MPNDLQSLLDGNARKTSQAVRATIEMAIGDGTGDYFCLLDSSGTRVRASVASSGLTFARRTPVMLISPDDGTVTTSRYVISQNRAATVLGTALPSPVRDDFDHEGVGVTYINPNPVTLIAGSGVPVQIDVYGTGLDSAVVVYGDVRIGNLSAAVVTPSRITLQVVADGALAHGGYDLTIGGITFPKFFTVT